ncbi:MAG TPA: sugar transferase [Candidatus Saccharimonadales bacterium]|nr:sugar transferase [Candidatus Saccharimonadales bacterium]
MVISKFNNSPAKRSLDVVVSTFSLLITSPLILLITILIRLSSQGPVFFLQKRTGKNGKVFKIIKFRTMVANAARIQSRYKKMNEADGPVFKIRDDPRFTKFGKLLSRTGFDELPQMINVLRGEMSIVGPRPLPINEVHKLTAKQRIRELVKPGVTSSWVIAGSHELSFKEWMDLDRKYVEKASLTGDLLIILKTIILMGGYILKH